MNKERVTVIGPAGIDNDYAVVDTQKRIVCECFGRIGPGNDGYVDAKYLADKIAEMMNEEYNQPETTVLFEPKQETEESNVQNS